MKVFGRGAQRGLATGLAGLFLTTLLISSPCLAALGKKEPSKEQKLWWKKFSGEVKQTELERHVRGITGVDPVTNTYPARLAGYPGAAKAADYIVGEMQKLEQSGVRPAASGGIEPKLPYREAYWVTVPWVDGQPTVEVMVGGKPVDSYDVYPLWPNLVRTSQLPEKGQTYPLIDGGDGSLAEFNGKDVDGTAVLMQFSGGTSWLNAPRLGAKAVIFVEPDALERGEAEAKFLRIPINIPRFWISATTLTA